MLDICPITLKEANAFVEQHHRHHKPVVGHKFSIGCTDGENIVGVAIVGRPVSRYLDDGWTLEVNRLATDGTKSACSMLYSAAWRAARAIGYKKLITYILDSEPGTSLKASGWKCVGERKCGMKNERCTSCKNRIRLTGWVACDGCLYNEGLEDWYEPMTNADRIRNMTDEELAQFLSAGELIAVCKECWLEWLRSPANDGGNEK